MSRTKIKKPTRSRAAERTEMMAAKPRASTAPSRTRRRSLSLEKFRDLLLLERQRLHDELEEMTARTARRGRLDSAVEEQDFDDNPGDAATETLERGTDLALERNLHDILEQIEDSLGKIESRTYGVCDVCTGPISVQRLEALPYATLCVECQGRLEQ